jgi:hypothetical protein
MCVNIYIKTYECKDVTNRGTKRLYGSVSQKIAELYQKQFQFKKWQYLIHSNSKCNGNIIHINFNDCEGTYNVGDAFNCITYKGEVNYTPIEKHDNNVIVDKVVDGSDIFIYIYI